MRKVTVRTWSVALVEETSNALTVAPAILLVLSSDCGVHYSMRNSLRLSIGTLAMEVEDHPISYNTFEGTIPQGEYGGGTVMLWDRGTYDAEDGGGAASLREGYRRGDLKFTLSGKRLGGSWVLVRMKRPGR